MCKLGESSIIQLSTNEFHSKIIVNLKKLQLKNTPEKLNEKVDLSIKQKDNHCKIGWFDTGYAATRTDHAYVQSLNFPQFRIIKQKRSFTLKKHENLIQFNTRQFRFSKNFSRESKLK